MPVTFTIAEKDYTYPEGWQDVTLQRFMDSFDAYKKPKELHTLESCKTDKEVRLCFEEVIAPNYPKIAQFYKDYVHHWTGISKDVLGKVEGSSVKLNGWDSKVSAGWMWIEKLYIQIRNNFADSEKHSTKLVEYIEHQGKKWYLPNEHLRENSLNGFIEVQQAKHVAQQLKGSHLAALPKMMCILLRGSKGAPYNPKQMDRERIFLKLPMDKVLQVSFFLLKLNQRFLVNSLIYTGLSHLSPQGHNGAQA